MSEFSPESSVETEIRAAIAAVIAEYFLPEDAELIAAKEDDEIIGALRGWLIELGEDPDKILQEYGVIERNEDEI